MKSRIILLLAFAMIIFSLSGLRNWQVYTNTTHIFDLVQVNDKIYMATWGGLEVYDLSSQTFDKTVTTIDGLSRNDLRTIDYYENSGELLLGSFGSGIDRFDGASFNMPLTEILGLGTDYVQKIVHQDTLIFAVTTFGFSLFADNPSFPFPLLISNFDIDKGLSSNEINDIQISEDHVFLATANGVDYAHLDSLLINNAWHNINNSNSALPSNFTFSLSARNKKLVIATDNGLLHIPDFTNSIAGEVIDAGVSIYPAYIDSDENIWFSYGSWFSELLILKDTLDIAIKKLASDGSETTWQIGEAVLTTNLIKGFTEIDEKICAYTWGEGLFLLEGNSWHTNIKPNSIMANLVADLELDQDKKLWVASGYLGLEELGKGTKGVCSFDGVIWQSYNKQSYPELKNNNVVDIEIDAENRKWFCSYQFIDVGTGGITVFDETNENWQQLSGLPSLYTTELFLDSQNRMWVSAFGHNFVMDIFPNIQIIDSFLSQNDEDNLSTITFVGEDKIFFGSYLKGLEYWNSTTIPYVNGTYWESAPSSKLNSGTIMDIEQRVRNNLTETWIASTNGLFMFDGSDWFLYGTNAKMSIWFDNQWFWSQDNPNPTYWYYVGQERLYGSNPTYPTSLFIDPFGRIWIGTAEYGITIFDKEADTFTNITTENSQLISDKITSFAYDETSGTLYIGTLEGISSVQIGISAANNQENDLHNVIAFPNPFNPENGEILHIENQESFTMPKGEVYCRIYDLNGELIVKLSKNVYEQFSWDGRNKADKKCGSGLYYYVVSAPGGQIGKGKILLVR